MTVALAALAAALFVVVLAAYLERRAWNQERARLVNRIIARHTGEVLALDRNDTPHEPKDREPPVIVEGLN
jgi:hypothetical protein